MSANTSNLNIINYGENVETIYFNFKIVYTEQVATFAVPTNLCIANFIEYIKFKTSEAFNTDINRSIEIVETGQETENLAAEEAPALQPDTNTTIRERYNGVYENVSFYIRLL